MQRIYLDNAATTPLDSEVWQAMEPYFKDIYGNPNSLHWFGQQARAAVDRSRELIAGTIGARFRDIVFTGSATEANNLALRGTVSRAKETFARLAGGKPMRIIVSAIEHSSILDTASDLEREGIDVVRVPVDARGVVDVDAIRDALDERTVLVSVMYANNETGVVQPIPEIASLLKTFRSRDGGMPYYPLFHTDAVQAFQYFDCNVDLLGVDLMTLSAHKLYGPKGVGMLYVRTMNSVTYAHNGHLHLIGPRITGGGQEFGMRSGTENVAAIVGFAKAVDLVVAHRDEEVTRLVQLRGLLWDGIKKVCPDAIVNGVEIKMDIRPRSEPRTCFTRGNDNISISALPNILNIYFPSKKGGELLIALDMYGIAVSSGSACAAFSAKPSHVLLAMGLGDARAGGSLRFSFGRYTTENDIKRAIEALAAVLTSS